MDNKLMENAQNAERALRNLSQAPLGLAVYNATMAADVMVALIDALKSQDVANG